MVILHAQRLCAAGTCLAGRLLLLVAGRARQLSQHLSFERGCEAEGLGHRDRRGDVVLPLPSLWGVFGSQICKNSEFDLFLPVI